MSEAKGGPAKAFADGLMITRAEARADLDAAVALALEGAADCRKWFHYPIEMPVTAEGQGPATVGVDAVEITYEVWDALLCSHASFDTLPDAINEAMRLNAARALIQPHQADALARVRREAHNAAIGVKPLVWTHYAADETYPEAWCADCCGGFYTVLRDGESSHRWITPNGVEHDDDLESAAEAKAAAQADYTARIHSALALPVDGGAKG